MDWIIIFIIFAYVVYRMYRKNEAKKEQETLIVKENVISNNAPKSQFKRFEFPVVGLNYENRKQTLKKIINQYKKEGHFYEKYEGLSLKEMREDCFGEKIYEISDYLEESWLEKEDDNKYDPNALKVMIKDINDSTHHIGYVPKEHCEEIRKYMDIVDPAVSAEIIGGKYKIAYDDEVETGSTPYGLRIHLAFKTSQ